MPIAVADQDQRPVERPHQRPARPALSPVERRRFAELCHHWFRLADQSLRDEPKAGALYEMKDGRGSN
jgi:hypothetical protein